MRFSARTVGLVAAAVTVLVWTSFIVIARASAGHTLTPFDIALARILGAGCVLLPWGAWLVRSAQRQGRGASSLFGVRAVRPAPAAPPESGVRALEAR